MTFKFQGFFNADYGGPSIALYLNGSVLGAFSGTQSLSPCGSDYEEISYSYILPGPATQLIRILVGVNSFDPTPATSIGCEISFDAPVQHVAEQVLQGFDGRCIFGVPAFPPCVLPQIKDRAEQILHASILSSIYTDSPATEDLIREYVGADASVTIVGPIGGIGTGYAVAVQSARVVAWISGTLDFQTIATQAFESLNGPTPAGSVSTLPSWYAHAHAVESTLNSVGAPGDRGIVLVGHSMGGAAACLIANDYRLGRPDRPIDLLTFACPRPGDGRLIDRLQQVRQCHVKTTNDPVPGLPPNSNEVACISGAASLALMFLWRQWRQASGSRILLEDGTTFDSDELTCGFDLLLDLTIAAVLHLGLPTFEEHFIDTYLARLRSQN